MIDKAISGRRLYYDVYGNLNMISVHNIFEDIDMLLKPMRATVSSSLENTLVSESMQEAFDKLRGVDIFSLKSIIDLWLLLLTGAWVLINELFVNFFFSF